MKNIHYGWVVCISGVLLIFTTMGLASNGFSLFLPYIMREHHLTHAQTSSLITVRCVVSFIAMLGIGIYYSKVSIRAGIAIAAACTTAAYFTYSAAQGYLTLCLGSVFAGLSYGLGSMVPVSILMGKWFMEKRSFAIGICAAGSGISTIILPPITTSLVEVLSMQTAFMLEGITALIVAVLLAIFVRNAPSEKNLEPYGKENLMQKLRSQGGRETGTDSSYTLSRKGWILIGGTCLTMGALANPGFSHLTVLFSGEGFRPSMVATIISSAGIVITLGKLVCGRVTDKIGGFRSSVLFMSMLFFGHVLCCFSFLQSVPLCVANVVVIGIGYPIATIGPSVWAGDMASQDNYPEAVRKLQVIYAGGALVFANVPGIFADIFGTYIPAYILFSGMIILSMGLTICAYRESRKKKPSSGNNNEKNEENLK